MKTDYVAYLSGPMTGYPGYNYQAFHEAARKLREEGVFVFNPADTNGSLPNGERETFLRHDVATVLQADVVIVLPGWTASRGARLEVLIAQELGIPVLEYESGDPVAIQVGTVAKGQAVAA